MADIFISYRRGITAPYARGVYERLGERFGRDRMFMDVDTMEPGVDFFKYIARAVDSCQVLIVVIGPDWLGSADAEGKRRLDDDDDFVRLEVRTALERDVRVIPVLVGGARMPSREDLPDDLGSLRRRNALELSDLRWDYDVGRLVKAVETVIGGADQPVVSPGAPGGPETAASPPPGRPSEAEAAAAREVPREGRRVGSAPGSSNRALVMGLVAAGLIAVVIAFVVALGGGEGDDESPGTASPAGEKAGDPTEENQPSTPDGLSVDEPVPRRAAGTAGERIGRSRAHHNLTLVELSNALHKPDGGHYSASLLGGLERGRRHRLGIYLGAADLLDLNARALGLDVPARPGAAQAKRAGRRLARARRSRGISSAAFLETLHKADGSHYPADLLGRVEQGRARAPVYLYLAAADLLGVKPSSLLGETIH